MVARVNHKIEELVVTLTDARGAVIHQETCIDGTKAAASARGAISKRAKLRAGDLLRVTVPPQEEGEVHNNPRELD
jgi:hypothetical protein